MDGFCKDHRSNAIVQEAEEEIKERIKELDFSGIHFLDSGNYHYLSKFWTEKIESHFLL